jgi:hypothetical protein
MVAGPRIKYLLDQTQFFAFIRSLYYCMVFAAFPATAARLGAVLPQARITAVRRQPRIRCRSVPDISGSDSLSFFAILLKSHANSSTGLKGPAAEKGMLIALLKLPGFPRQAAFREWFASAGLRAHPEWMISAVGLRRLEASRASA